MKTRVFDAALKCLGLIAIANEASNGSYQLMGILAHE